jgi:ABC-type lipoprotein release transport system permease subunit
MKKHLLSFVNAIKSPLFWKSAVKAFIHFWPQAFHSTLSFSKFFLLLLVFLVGKVYGVLEKIPVINFPFKKLEALWRKTVKIPFDAFLNRIDRTKTSEIKRSYLITVAYRNLLSKKTRSLITIMGMSVGVGIIVLLLSLGYGIEKLIIGQVASLDELKIVDVSTGGNTTLRLGNELMKKIKGIDKVEDVVPLISLVGRVTFNKANTDVLVYGAPNSYLEYTKIKLKSGKLFASSNKVLSFATSPSVAGASESMQKAKIGEPISSTSLHFTIDANEPQVVWSECSATSKVLGFVPHVEGGYSGREVWGSSYYPFSGEAAAARNIDGDGYLGKWVQGKVALHYKSTDTTYRPALDEGGRQLWVEGCMPKTDVLITDLETFSDVLGDATESAELEEAYVESEATDSAEFADFPEASSAAEIEIIDLQASSAAKFANQKTINFKNKPSYEALVSSSMMNLLGIKDNAAVGSTFKVSFIVSKALFPEIEGKANTEEVSYKIIGVIDDENQPYFYIPIGDIQKLGSTNYSQMKIVLSQTDSASAVRKQVEVLGLRTASTADTVAQIEALFANLRIVLGLLGLVALGVASLGMFNTLTVSLLERTREIGGMKTMGMVSDEVQDLFLAEAMIMGLSGGIGGLFMGFVIGKGLSVLVSFVALSQGEGILNLTHIPPFLILFILVSSFFVGLITGLYPARRAKKISALNALRYE